MKYYSSARIKVNKQLGCLKNADKNIKKITVKLQIFLIKDQLSTHKKNCTKNRQIKLLRKVQFYFIRKIFLTREGPTKITRTYNKRMKSAFLTEQFLQGNIFHCRNSALKEHLKKDLNTKTTCIKQRMKSAFYSRAIPSRK